MHSISALACSIKAFTGWTAIDSVAESRKACGGNGFSKFALFGDIFEFVDIGQTAEGDHNVILLKASSYLLHKTGEAQAAKFSDEISMEFLKQSIDEKSGTKYSPKCLKSQVDLFADKANYFCHQTLKEFKALTNKKVNATEYLHPTLFKKMCQSHYEFFVVKSYVRFLESFTDENTRKVFEDVLRLYVAYRIYKEAEYFRSVLGSDEFDEVPNTIISLCKSLRNEVILLTDSLPYPDKVMGVWGAKDMDGYARFLGLVRSVPGVSERPAYWKNISSAQ